MTLSSSEGGSATLNSYPQEPLSWVGRKRIGKGNRFAASLGGESQGRFTASLFACGSGNQLRYSRDFRCRLRRHDCPQGGYPAVLVHDAGDRQCDLEHQRCLVRLVIFCGVQRYVVLRMGGQLGRRGTASDAT
jgi:hypothetical protein